MRSPGTFSAASRSRGTATAHNFQLDALISKLSQSQDENDILFALSQLSLQPVPQRTAILKAVIDHPSSDVQAKALKAAPLIPKKSSRIF